MEAAPAPTPTPAPATVIDRVLSRLSADGVAIPPPDTASSTSIGEIPLDSLEWVYFATQLEDEFGVELPDGELLDCDTLGDIANLIEAKLSAQASR